MMTVCENEASAAGSTVLLSIVILQVEVGIKQVSSTKQEVEAAHW